MQNVVSRMLTCVILPAARECASAEIGAVLIVGAEQPVSSVRKTRRLKHSVVCIDYAAIHSRARSDIRNGRPTRFRLLGFDCWAI
eukprot:SAG31_NODE_2040_length_6591_cov_8.808996_3_plen_85_part_00